MPAKPAAARPVTAAAKASRRSQPPAAKPAKSADSDGLAQQQPKPTTRASRRGDTDLLTGSSAPAQPALQGRSLEAELGAEIRRLRYTLDLTVAELCAAAGISSGMLSKIENGTTSASLTTVNSLARALNVPIGRLFVENDEQRDASFVKAGTGVRIDRRGTRAGHLYDLLGHSLAGDIAVEPYLITLSKDAAPYDMFRHAGLEFLYMLSGKVRYRHMDRSFVLEPGDALFFDAAGRHGPEELIEAPMQYLSIIIYPRKS